jgi:hypothetical protein
MKKGDILKLIGKSALAAGSLIDPRIGLAAKGVEALIKRDNDPSNDAEETATALTDIILNTIAVSEEVTHDVIDNDILQEIAANTKAQILFNIQMFKLLKARPAT